jgi:hypothetical protein
MSADNLKSPSRHPRRLSDHVLIAFHHACDQGELDVARSLLRVLDFMLQRGRNVPSDALERRRNVQSLVAAHERLWHMHYSDARELNASASSQVLSTQRTSGFGATLNIRTNQRP